MSDSGDVEQVESNADAVDAVEDEADDPADVDTSHLDDVEDGCGCAEVWEHLSEERED